ncbi:MAG: hypothetical protein V1690_02490 [Candidatus Moraniibacteriota bacterium]
MKKKRAVAVSTAAMVLLILGVMAISPWGSEAIGFVKNGVAISRPANNNSGGSTPNQGQGKRSSMGSTLGPSTLVQPNTPPPRQNYTPPSPRRDAVSSPPVSRTTNPPQNRMANKPAAVTKPAVGPAGTALKRNGGQALTGSQGRINGGKTSQGASPMNPTGSSGVASDGGKKINSRNGTYGNQGGSTPYTVTPKVAPKSQISSMQAAIDNSLKKSKKSGPGITSNDITQQGVQQGIDQSGATKPHAVQHAVVQDKDKFHVNNVRTTSTCPTCGKQGCGGHGNKPPDNGGGECGKGKDCKGGSDKPPPGGDTTTTTNNDNRLDGRQQQTTTATGTGIGKSSVDGSGNSYVDSNPTANATGTGGSVGAVKPRQTVKTGDDSAKAKQEGELTQTAKLNQSPQINVDGAKSSSDGNILKATVGTQTQIQEGQKTIVNVNPGEGDPGGQQQQGQQGVVGGSGGAPAAISTTNVFGSGGGLFGNNSWPDCFSNNNGYGNSGCGNGGCYQTVNNTQPPVSEGFTYTDATPFWAASPPSQPTWFQSYVEEKSGETTEVTQREERKKAPKEKLCGCEKIKSIFYTGKIVEVRNPFDDLGPSDMIVTFLTKRIPQEELEANWMKVSSRLAESGCKKHSQCVGLECVDEESETWLKKDEKERIMYTWFEKCGFGFNLVNKKKGGLNEEVWKRVMKQEKPTNFWIVP